MKIDIKYLSKTFAGTWRHDVIGVLKPIKVISLFNHNFNLFFPEICWLIREEKFRLMGERHKDIIFTRDINEVKCYYKKYFKLSNFK